MTTVRVGESVLVGNDLVINEWPFFIELLPLSSLCADKYQRPPQTAFINKLANNFDPTLVGVLDVSARKDGRYAILDGLQRKEVLKIHKINYVWCAVYDGMSIVDEARFFLKRNKDRKNVHAYYQFNARVIMTDNLALAIDRIVRSEGFRMGINAADDTILAAIKAVEDAYGYSSPYRRECLSPTLNLIAKVLFARKSAKDGTMIRGLARLFQAYSDEQIDITHLEEVMAHYGPQNILGRASDMRQGMGGGSSRGFQVAQVVVDSYNKGFKPRLPMKQLNALR